MAARLVAVLGTEGTFWRMSTITRDQGDEEFGERGCGHRCLSLCLRLCPPVLKSPSAGTGVLILPSQKAAAEVLSRDVYTEQDFLACSGEGVGGGQVSGGCLKGCWSPRGSLVPPNGHPRDALSRCFRRRSQVQEGRGRGLDPT